MSEQINKQLLDALKANHGWFVGADERGGYATSNLCKQNVAAIEAAKRVLNAEPRLPTVDLIGKPLNDACWAFIDATPNNTAGMFFTSAEFKPALKAAIEKYLVEAKVTTIYRDE